jgi:transposase
MVRPMLASDRGSQPALLPVDARDLLPAGHLAWEILAVVDELDLSRFHAAYRSDGRGRPPYDPATMIALLFYCYRKNIRGSRAIEEACRVDLGCRVITGNRYPDHATISRFLTDHGPALRGLLAQSLRLCDDAGLIDLALIAGDGTKVAANAAMDATVDEAALHRQITDLQTQIADVEAHWQAAITAPAGTRALFNLDLDLPTDLPTDFPTDLPTDRSAVVGERDWRKLNTLHRTLQARLRALEHLATHPTTDQAAWEARLARDQARIARCQASLDTLHAKVQTAYEQRLQAEAAGARIPGTRPVPADRNAHVRNAEDALNTAITRARATAANPPTTGKVNTTDPHSRIMPTKHGGYDQLYNLQATATASQVILGITLHDNPNDKQALIALLTTTRHTLDQAGINRPIGTAVFDSGYASDANFTAELPVDLLLVAPERETRQTERLPAEQQPTIPQAWQVMAARLAEPANRARYRRRGAIIEPVFAQLFNHFGHNLHLRGAAQTGTELHIWAVSHNLGKLIRHRRTTRSAAVTRAPG